ncbi:hypothetical protein MSIBF_A2950004 [groundwater metagenome]|uniref:Uncharacterized protein n=1 Tax=groundwater metagenome TaxID=717931 RepID=A0A098EBP7_9ZZZZ
MRLTLYKNQSSKFCVGLSKKISYNPMCVGLPFNIEQVHIIYNKYNYN